MFAFKKPRFLLPRTLLVALVPFIFGGCLSNHAIVTNSIANENVYKMKQLHVGMTKREVYEVMRYPTVEDQIETADGNYDIWFYITKANILDQDQYTARNLTPLIFKDGVFVAIGRNYYNQLVERANQPQFNSPEPTKELENVPMEQALTPDSKTDSSKPKSEPARKKHLFSMSRKPKKADSSSNNGKDSSKPDMDDEDQEMLYLEKKENFDDW